MWVHIHASLTCHRFPHVLAPFCTLLHFGVLRYRPKPFGKAKLRHSSRLPHRNAHLAPSYIGETVRANFTTLGIVEPSNLKPISSANLNAGAKRII
jgi:hypothetical protein